MKHRLICAIQRAQFPGGVNSDAPRDNEKQLTGIRLISDLRYAGDYPNSYCDLYQSPVYSGSPLPVFIYCHGGGYTWGDKAEGDPNGEGQGLWYFESLLRAGYHVASVNYALAPEYQYPVPLRQLNQCVVYLKAHAAEYGLDMEHVIFAGGSAGAHLSGQYVNVVTDPDYAAEMKISPALKGEDIMAYVSSSGLLDCERFDRTDSRIFNLVLRKCAQAAFGIRRFHGDTAVRSANVITYMTKDFPPCFISDGNRGTFTDQARDMASKADALGIRHILKLYPKSDAVLGHDFERGDSEQAKEVMKELLAFLASL